MSEQGIKLATEAFQQLQRLSYELLKMGAGAPASASGKQDIRLGQMMNIGKDAMKEIFMEITKEPKP